MAYKDKDRQREAQRERTRRYRAKEKGVTSQGVTHLTDACGKGHLIDFEGRRRDRVRLDAWAKGEGTPWQQYLGLLSKYYTLLKA